MVFEAPLCRPLLGLSLRLRLCLQMVMLKVPPERMGGLAPEDRPAAEASKASEVHTAMQS